MKERDFERTIFLYDEIVRLSRKLGYAEGVIAGMDIELLRYSHPTWPNNYYVERWNSLLREVLPKQTE